MLTSQSPMPPSALHAAGDDGEVPAVGLVVVALGAIDHQADHRQAGPVAAVALPQRGRGVGAARAALRCLAHQRAQRRGAVGIGQRARRRRCRPEAEVLRPQRAHDESAVCVAAAQRQLALREEGDRRRIGIGSVERDLRHQLQRHRPAVDAQRAPVVGQPRIAQLPRRRHPDQRRVVDRCARGALLGPATQVVEGRQARRVAGQRQARPRHGDGLLAKVPGGLAQRRARPGTAADHVEVGGRIQAEPGGSVGRAARAPRTRRAPR